MTAAISVHRIGVVEDNPTFREHLCGIISVHDEFSLAFDAETCAQALSAMQREPADLYLLDIQLPDGSGLDLARHVKTSSSAHVLMLTVLGDRASVLQAFDSGADGYLLKDTGADELRRSILSTLAGDTPISPRAATHLLQSFRRLDAAAPDDANLSVEKLTAREVETLDLFARGLSYQETAEVLGISHNTVRSHVKAIYAKLDVNSRNEAVFEAMQLGWIKSAR